MYDVDHPAYAELQGIGKYITAKVKLEAVIVFSAHWQAEGYSKIQVNTKENADLIYE